MALFLKITLRVLVLGAIFSFLLQRLVIPGQPLRSLGPLLVLLVSGAAWYLLVKKKKTRAAIQVLVIGIWAAVSTVITLTNGVLSPMIASYSALIIGTGWLLGYRAALAMTSVTVVGIFALAIGEVTGLLTMLPSVPRLLGAGVTAMVLVISVAMVGAAMRLNQARITELRRVGRELELRTQELETTQRELTQAQAVAMMGSWTYDFASDVLKMSDETCRLFGLPVGSEGSLATFEAQVHPDDVALVHGAWNAAKYDGIFDVEYRTVLGQTTHWVHSRAEVTTTPDGVLHSAMGISKDITERKHHEVELTAALHRMQHLARERDESESRFRALMENIEGVAVQGYAMDGTVTYWNAAAQRLYGYSAAEAMGANLMDLIIPAGMREGVSQAMRDMAATGVAIPAGELLLTSKCGAAVPVFSSHALVQSLGRPAELFCMDIDLSVRKKFEAELMAAKADAEQANRAKSTFLTAVSHDLGQPLSALSLLVSVFKHSATPTTNRLIQNMQDCVDGMSGLLTDLMDVSKLDAGVVSPKPTDFSVQELFASVVSVQAVEAQIKGLRLRIRGSAAFAHTDFKLVQRILGNLVSNAVRHTPSGGVLLACRVRGGKQWVEVWDTGVGIAPDKTELVFKEFTQLKDNARTIGSGLGLAIVAKTARLLGLEVRLRSQVGRGSMFAIELPPGRACAVAGPVVVVPRLRPSRIGLVDDNAMLLESLVFALEDAKYEVVAACSGQDLLARLGAQAPDIVISDYRLGGGETGIDVIDATRRVFGADLPCLIITADTGPAVSMAMANRNIAVLYKPLDVAVFLTFVKEATERRKSLDGAVH